MRINKTNSTELSEHFREMKRKGIENPITHWLVTDYAKSYANGSKSCKLCLTKKYHIPYFNMSSSRNTTMRKEYIYIYIYIYISIFNIYYIINNI